MTTTTLETAHVPAHPTLAGLAFIGVDGFTQTLAVIVIAIAAMTWKIGRKQHD